MFQQHLDLTTGELVGQLKKDWATDIRSCDEGHPHLSTFADRLLEAFSAMSPKTNRPTTSPRRSNKARRNEMLKRVHTPMQRGVLPLTDCAAATIARS